VYTLGHRSIPIEGRLVAALLYAGPDALLSHTTAAWWWGLIEGRPPLIHVSCPRRVGRSNGVIVHQRSYLDPARHRRFPITSVAQTLLDYAAEAQLLDVRRALAQADYRRLLDPDEVHAVLGQGRNGTATLRAALGRHEPTLARARSWLEVAFVPLCESAGIPLPEINVRVADWTVDALWREERVVVELDGYDNHSTRAQMERDRRKELDLRAAGFLVVRYTRDQVVFRPELVAADLLARLTERAASSPAARSA
jgi:very-short-patch-repair endonuclease